MFVYKILDMKSSIKNVIGAWKGLSKIETGEKEHSCFQQKKKCLNFKNAVKWKIGYIQQCAEVLKTDFLLSS